MSVMAWELARKRAGLYCHFHHVPETQIQYVLDQACAALQAQVHTPLNEAELIKQLIDETQLQLVKQGLGQQQALSAASANDSQLQPGYRRAQTGPVLERSSIRAAVLEKI